MPPKRSTVCRDQPRGRRRRRRDRRRCASASAPSRAMTARRCRSASSGIQPVDDDAGAERRRSAPAMPRPMPEVDPVMSATLPAKRGHGRARASASAGSSTDLMTPPVVHRVERVAPPVERRAQPDDRLGHGHAGVEQMNHALPGPRKLWLNEPCSRTLPCDQRVDVDGDHVRRPADFDHVAIRPGEPQRRLRACRSRRTHRTPDRRRAATASAHEIAQGRGRPVRRIGGARRRPRRRGAASQPRPISSPASPTTIERVGAARARPSACRAGRSGPGPENDDRVARADGRVHAHRVVGHRVRLGRGRPRSNGSEAGTWCRHRAATRTYCAIAPSMP